MASRALEHAFTKFRNGTFLTYSVNSWRASGSSSTIRQFRFTIRAGSTVWRTDQADHRLAIGIFRDNSIPGGALHFVIQYPISPPSSYGPLEFYYFLLYKCTFHPPGELKHSPRPLD